jgi:outer membrane immunogenic protein
LHRFRFAALAAVAVVGFASVASAADMPLKAPRPVVVAPIYSWTGFYIGGDIGYGSGRSDGVLNDGVFNGAPVPYSADPRGMIGGGFAGYNYQIGQFVVGVEADWQAANLSGSGTGTFLVSSYTMDTKVSNYGSVRGRLGFAMDRWLVFATGGWAWGNAQTSYSDTGAPPPFGTNKINGSGGTIGAGIEYAVTNNWLARVEYRYTDLGNHGFEVPSCGCGDNGNRITINDVRFGLSYKFGDWGKAPVVAKY